MSSYYTICCNSCKEVNPIPLSSYLMKTCEAACNGQYNQDDIRCFSFCCTPCSFVIDIISWCPRCMIKCCKDIKQKNGDKKVISIQPIKTISSTPDIYTVQPVYNYNSN